MTHLLRLRADAGMRLPASDAKWCALFPRGGWHHHTGGDIEFTDELAAAFIASWKAAGSPPLPITLHHVPDDIDVVAKRTAGEAEGWIEDLRIGEGDIALEGAVAWTDPAKALIKADRWRYLSPEWSMQHTDRRTGAVGGPWLYGAALLNDPFFHSMPRVAASQQPTPTHHTPSAHQAKEQHMSMQRIRATFRLADGATDATTADEAEKLVAANARLTAEKAELEAKLTAATKDGSDKLAGLASAVEKLTASNAEFAKKLADAEAQRATAELDALFASATREGKVVSDTLRASVREVATHLGFAKAKALVDQLPKSVAIDTELGHGAGVEPAPADYAALKAAYDKDLDERIKAGAKTLEATRQLRIEGKHAAYLKASSTTFTTQSR